MWNLHNVQFQIALLYSCCNLLIFTYIVSFLTLLDFIPILFRSLVLFEPSGAALCFLRVLGLHWTDFNFPFSEISFQILVLPAQKDPVLHSIHERYLTHQCEINLF